MRNTITLGIVLAASLAGCASWFLRGAEMANGAPAASTAVYTAPACALANGQIVAGPAVTYYLTQEAEGAILYEIETNGRGARITNRWSDETGTYFFVWVGNGPGWQYFFPVDPTLPRIRLAFDAGTYSGDHSTGVTRPVGTPSATCVLEPR
jgi:hypothetical protein